MKQPLAAVFLIMAIVVARPLLAADAPSGYGEALRWHEKTAEAGAAPAQFLLGRMFETGKGRKPDTAKAAGWYRRAADQGYAPAQFRLGVLYFEGRGVTRDAAAAAAWYEKAAAQGHLAAKFNLGFLYQRGEGVAADRARAEALYRETAMAGLAQARFNLGLMLAGSDEARRDRHIEAWMWLALAAKAGVPNAQKARDAQQALLSPAEREKAEARLAAGASVR